MLILTIVLSILVILLIAVIYNLLQKVEKLEDIILRSDNFYTDLKEIINMTSKKLEEIDEKGAFSSDDEIGWFFTTIRELQQDIDRYVEQSYAKDTKQ